MPAGARPPLALSTLLVAVGLVMAAQAFTQSDTPEIQLQLGKLLYADGRFSEALDGLRACGGLAGAPRARPGPHRAGSVGAAHRELPAGQNRSRDAARRAPSRRLRPGRLRRRACGRRACSMKPNGGYQEALAIQPDEARGHNGASRGALPRGAATTRRWSTACRPSGSTPREADFHHTLGNIYERIGALRPGGRRPSASFINLLPKRT